MRHLYTLRMGAPDIDTRLGWNCPCLNVADLQASLDWYGKLGFSLTGGEPEQNWATTIFGSSELHMFQGMIERNLVHFRGGLLEAIDMVAGLQGLKSKEGAVYHEGEDAWFLEFTDPAGNVVFLNTYPGELEHFQAGGPTCIIGLAVEKIDNSRRMLQRLACPGLQEVVDFYAILGLEAHPQDDGTVLMRQEGISLLLDAAAAENSYELKLPAAEIPALQQAMGSDSDSLRDPDGNLVLLSSQ